MSDANQERPSDSPPGLPRWVKLLAIGALIVLIVLVVAALATGGDHGPGQHDPTGALPNLFAAIRLLVQQA